MNHHLESLGWTLVHFCWQAGAIALVYWLADVALSKARSHMRYLLALGAMLLMLVAALVTLGYEETHGHSDLSFSSSAVGLGANATDGGSSISIDLTSLAGLNTTGATKQPVLLHVTPLLPWLDVAWLLGVACLSTRTIGGWWLIQRLRRKATVDAPEAVRANFVHLCKRLGITRHVDLRISERIQGPLAMGIVRSLILLPASALMALSPEQLEVVLAHELAHVRRADYLWNLIQTMVETLFFFHPAVWWLGRRLRQQRELCCDDVAIQSCADPLVYATALLRLEEQRSRQLNLAMALDGHQSLSGLRMRIARILGEGTGEKGQRELAPLPLAAICAALIVLLLPLPRVFAGLQSKPQHAQVAASMISAPVVAEPEPPTMEIDTPVALQATPLVPVISPKVSIAPTTSVFTATSESGETVELVAGAQGAGTGEGRGSGYGSGANGYGIGDKTDPQDVDANASSHKADYIDRMRAAGYDVDLDKYIAMKVQDITPEYARDMEKAGFGKPSADDLIAMKVQGVTPDYVSKLRAAGIEPSSIGDLVSYRIFSVTPEFLSGMKAAGFSSIPPNKLIELRVQGITPEYAKAVKQQYPNVTLDELVQLRIFHIDDAFLASAKRHGFTSLSIQKLVQLRVSGVLGDDDAEAK
jgi:beta-lactamase regulating signal transducer with metallopeptidase domain